ncbi:MAG: glycosyl transferase family A [Nitrospiraceae bacterium]|nr:MAG: glycosyl transferase family A [Nitrospiraceae bacterium]
MHSTDRRPRELILCICTCGRPAGLERVLRAVDGLEWPEGEMPSFAVVVVDNLPDGRARDVVERLRGFFRWPLHFVEEPERGISQARNRAVAEALALGAEFVAFVDDDDVPKPDWLWWLWKRQRETGADLVFGGWVLVLRPDASPLARAFKERQDRSAIAADKFGLPGRAATRNVLIGRRVLERLNARDGIVFSPKFDACGGEDTEMFYRALASGSRCISCNESIVEVSVPGGFVWILRRQFRYGYAHVHIMKNLGRKPENVAKTIYLIAKHAVLIATFPIAENIVVRIAKIARRLGQLRARLPGEFRYYGRASRHTEQ